jgi:Rieske 2Fe-2S family protein
MTFSQQQAEVLDTAQDFEKAMTPPGWIFWDPDLYERDIREIFGRMWLCVGHRSRLSEPGSYFLVDFGLESIIIVMDEQNQHHAFYNVCRHRGTRIVKESTGKCRGFLCPYHSWHYSLDGTLRTAPLMDEMLGFDKNNFPLRRVQLEEFMGFLFINLDENTESIANTFADFPDFKRLDIPNLVRVGYHDYLVDSNWKLICENYHECYHCANAHPQLHRISDFGGLPNSDESGINWIGGPMSIKSDFNTMTISGTTDRQPLTGCTDADKRLVYYFNLLPNCLLSICPDYLLTHYLRPRGPEQVYIETEWFCSTEQMKDPTFDPSDAIAFWHKTNKQDWALCENAMKGLKSSGHLPGRYQAGETCTHLFDQWYVKKMFKDVIISQ